VNELDVLAVEKRVVDICRAVVEGGEEEAQLGRKSDMSGGAGVEVGAFTGQMAQTKYL